MLQCLLLIFSSLYSHCVVVIWDGNFVDITKLPYINFQSYIAGYLCDLRLQDTGTGSAYDSILINHIIIANLTCLIYAHMLNMHIMSACTMYFVLLHLNVL